MLMRVSAEANWVFSQDGWESAEAFHAVTRSTVCASAFQDGVQDFEGNLAAPNFIVSVQDLIGPFDPVGQPFGQDAWSCVIFMRR